MRCAIAESLPIKEKQSPCWNASSSCSSCRSSALARIFGIRGGRGGGGNLAGAEGKSLVGKIGEIPLCLRETRGSWFRRGMISADFCVEKYVSSFNPEKI